MIQLFFSDVDGTLTDSGIYYTSEGVEFKKFNMRDGMGFELLRNKGIETGIITSEETIITELRAKKLKIDYVYQGKKFNSKLESVAALCASKGLSLSEVAYIGDDINCFELLSNVGVAACPSDASDAIKKIPGIKIMNKKGGKGAVRAFVDYLIEAELHNK